MKNEIAILMAAGLGSRLAPLTQKTPKPLVKVHGVSMIETVLAGLNKRGVDHIYVVVGHLKEQFKYLEAKYSNLTLIENKEYLTINNISSIKAACPYIGNNNCFICEADLFVSDPSIFEAEIDHSCYFGKFIKEEVDEWVFDLDENGIITHVGRRVASNMFNMCGIAYFKAREANIIKQKIEEYYKHPGTYETLFWDNVVNENLKELNINVHEVQPSQIVEIDSLCELEVEDPDYQKYN